MSQIKWQGVYPALLTPFKKDETIDFEMFGLNLEAQVKAGIEGVVIGGSLGESSTLEKNELMDLLQFSRQLLPGKIPVIVNIAEQSTTVAIKSAQAAEKNGADGLMLLPPLRYKADDRETVGYIKSIASNTSLPIMIYNNPHDYKIEVTLEMFEELSKISGIQAVKESTRDVSNVTRMRNYFGDRYKILCGVDTLALEELALGADGWIGGLVDAFPAESVAVYKLMKAGKYTEALQIYRWFLPVLELDIHPKLVQYIKLASQQTGLGTEFVRAPRLRLEGEERKRILAVIDHAISTRPVLPDYLNLVKRENVGSL
ncbi:MAG TPA: dihydrodipicolinate synthase family protein [Puia sp.]|jgi:dihydrodipicolinate synthase/N-acetylneuraminate lyase|nr:dihydrodipicolinate synthase family protein [Puia sp.]